MIPRALLLVIGLCVSFVAAHAGDAPARLPFLAGYLAKDMLPDSLALLPSPPEARSPRMDLDEADEKAAQNLASGPRWSLAAIDADLALPAAAAAFSCAVQAPIDAAKTPNLLQLLRRSITDVIGAAHAAKDHYSRKRPFLVDGAPICTPDLRDALAKESSYPSAHAATGWAWALILSEVAPDRANLILARGLAFGQSRVICNVHWQSDVDAARLVAAATVARLHAEPDFRADVEAAKAELEGVRARGLAPNRDCAAEAAALGGAR